MASGIKKNFAKSLAVNDYRSSSEKIHTTGSHCTISSLSHVVSSVHDMCIDDLPEMEILQVLISLL